MAFALDPRQALGPALRTAALAQVDDAIARSGSARGVDIHEARKSCKRLRAWARLLRPQLAAHYAPLNALLRDAARRLSGCRDAAVMRDTVKRLQRGRHLSAAQASTLHKALDATDPAQLHADQRAEAQVLLAAARVYVAGLDADIDRAALLQRLRASRKRCRHGLRAVRRAQRAEALHDWRKRVKYHGYQCALVAGVFPEIRSSVPALKVLGETLGLHHDFHLLCARLQHCPAPGARLRRHAADLARAQMDRLAADALRQGARLFE